MINDPLREVCWLNEDCIAGHHMDEIECRFPSWQDDAARQPCGVPITYEAMVARTKQDPSFREGLLAAASICRAQGVDPSQPSCPSGMAAVYIERVASGEQP